jgi:phosphoenolpyruvate phosphomutase
MRSAADGVRLIARTEALVAGLGVDEAVARLRMYAAAGADALFVQFNRSCHEQLAAVLEQVRGLRPIVLAPTALPELHVADFARLGADTVLFANVVARAIAASLPVTLATLHRTGCLADVSGRMADVATILDLMPGPR